MTYTDTTREPTSARARRLLAQADEAAQIRDAMTHPDVVALRVERVRYFGEILLWMSIGTFLIFTIITVQRFVARGAERGTLEWFGAWFLEPAIIGGLVTVLIWEGAYKRQSIHTGPRARVAKWGLLVATYIMNTWDAWSQASSGGSWGPLAAHSIPPLAVFWLTEAREEILDKLEETVVKAHAYALGRRRERIERMSEFAQLEQPTVEDPTCSRVSTMPIVSPPADPPPPVTRSDALPIADPVRTINAPFMSRSPVGSATPPLFTLRRDDVQQSADETRVDDRVPSSTTVTASKAARSSTPSPRLVGVGAHTMSYGPETAVSSSGNGRHDVTDPSTASTGSDAVSDAVTSDDNLTVTNDDAPRAATASGTAESTINADKPTEKSRSSSRGGRTRSPEVETQANWIRDRLRRNLPVTGSMVDDHFNNTGRNGSRLVRSVKAEPEFKQD